METFDTDAAKLAGYSTFNVENYTVNVEVPDVDGRLDDQSVEDYRASRQKLRT
jgi:hypothetical protein